MKEIMKLALSTALILSLSTAVTATAANNNHTHTNKSSKAKNLISDSAITAAIKGKYALDDQVNALDVKVETINGEVIITGKVADSSTAERAITLARETEGVKRVTFKASKIWHSPKEKSTAGNLISDSAITTSIKAKYAADDTIKVFDIHVKTVNGRVTLTGTVPSFTALDHAISIAQNVDGVREVASHLHVRD